MDIQFNLGDIKVVKKQLGAAAASAPSAMALGLYQEAETIMTAAKRDYVPVDFGTLRDSGFVDGPEETPTGVTQMDGESVVQFKTVITIGFGGPAAPYALYVHEDLTKRHTVGQAKYLETPIKARLGGMAAILALWTENVIRQAIQRKTKIKANIRAGRDRNWGMPLFRGS